MCVGYVIEIARVDERRHERTTLGRGIAILDGERDVADVPVERVAVQQEEERRNENEDQQRAPIAPDLPQLFAAYRERLRHAAVPPAERGASPEPVRGALSITSRNTSSSDGATSATDSTSMPEERRRSASASGRMAASRSTACTAVPKRLVFSTSGVASRSRIASIALAVRVSAIGRPSEIRLTSVVVPIAARRPA